MMTSVTRRKALTSATAALALASCTGTLVSTPLTPEGQREGVGYSLPFTQWATTVTWRLGYCPDPANPTANNGADAQVLVKVDALAGTADDGTLAFIIDPRLLQTPTSVTSFGVKYYEGTNNLQSINASVEDRSAQVVANLVRTATKVIPLLAGAGAPPSPSPTATIFCSADSAKALAAAKAAKGNLDAANTAVEAAAETLTAANARIAALGSAVTDAARTDLDRAYTALAQAKSRQTDLAAALESALAKVSIVRKLEWPTSSAEFSGAPLLPDAAAFAKWFDPASAPRPRPVYFQIERRGTFGRAPSRADMRTGGPAPDPANPVKIQPGDAAYRLPDTSSPGLHYRMMARGRLVVCSNSPCGTADPTSVIASFDGPVAQLGFVNVLPFRSRAFGTTSFTAELAPDGSLESYGTEQKSAPLEGATGALADTATNLSTILDPTARLNSKTAYLKALKEYQAALAASRPAPDDPVADETTSLNAETTLLNAKLARLKAEIALQQAQGGQ
ncbi:MAG: hypothetical protein PGN23_07245 [Sphingomonas adhaesiva]|uniref:hypothetical protein n=1 Tax=Sphingomonas adhaesiva TaxID=28212 RepID=UPI002FFB7183